MKAAKAIVLSPSRTTTDALVDGLRDAIRSNAVIGGQRLTEADLAAQFGVSRIPLREALRRLEGEGLVAIHANRGAVVTELSEEDIREIYELRMLIEGDLIARAAQRMTPAILQRAQRLHEMLEKEKEPAEQDKLNREFHATLHAAAGRPRHQAFCDLLRNLVERYQHANLALMSRTQSFQADHKKILAACRDRNSRTANAHTIHHLESAMKLVLEHVRTKESRHERRKKASVQH